MMLPGRHPQAPALTRHRNMGQTDDMPAFSARGTLTHPSEASTEEPYSDLNEAFITILDRIDQVDTLRGAQTLRSLAERSERVIELLDVASAGALALQELPDVADALERLADHRDILVRLMDLENLADDIGELSRAMRAVRGHRDQIEWAAEEDWENGKER